MKFDIKKSAFTLSEIMITISLIGFLATLTLSNIGASIQIKSRLSQFRTAYARMDAVLKSITSEEGLIYQCYSLPTDDETNNFHLNLENGTTASSNSNSCSELTNKFVRAMGATRFCEGDAEAQGCVPRNYPTASGCFLDYDNVGAYVLDNSMIIVTDAPNNLRTFLVDVNGRKGPNKFGQDIFVFSVKATESVNSHRNIIVTQLGILPGDVDGCTVPMTGSSKSTLDMMKESASFKGAWQNSNTGSYGN